MATLEQLQSALVKADQAGNVADAKALANAIKQGSYEKADPLQLPEFASDAGVEAIFGGGPHGNNLSEFWDIHKDQWAQMVTLNPKARIDGIKKRFPDLQVQEFGDDNAVMFNPETGGSAVLNAEGISAADVLPILGAMGAATPAGRWAAGAKTAVGGVGRLMLGEAATDGALQLGEIAQGSEQGIDPVRTAAVAAGAGAAGSVGFWARNRALRNEKLKGIIQNNPDSRVARYTLDGAGNLKTDKYAQEALRQGFDDGVVATVKGASPADKAKMNQMVNIAEKGSRNPKYAAVSRPSDVIGESVMQRFNTVMKANRQAGRRLDGVAKSLRGQQVDVSSPVNSFLDDLNELGITLDDSFNLGFKNSDIEGLPGLQKVFARVVGRMKNTRSPDAFDVHRMKRYLDEQLTYGKTVEGLSGRTETVLKRLRHNLDSVLDSSFPEYDAVNQTYSSTRQVLDEFQGVAGRKLDLTSGNATKSVGTLTRRVLSNAQSRVQLMDSLQNLQDVAIANGGKFEDDLITQVVFADDLQRMFGGSAKTSFEGGIEKSLKRVADQAGSSQGLGEMAVNAVTNAVEKARGIDEEGAFEAIRALLAN